MDNKLYEEFQNPGTLWRGKPFWSWNGELNQAELIRQVHVIKKMGFGGYFMHSRCGLATEYLGRNGFHCAMPCPMKEADLGWNPGYMTKTDGQAGVPAAFATKDVKYRMRFLTMERVAAEDFSWKDDMVTAFCCDLEGINLFHYDRLNPTSDLAPFRGKTVLVFRIIIMREHPVYNGGTYLDTMSREATNQFLQVTHEKYVQECHGRVGTTIKGIFTDEPTRGALMCNLAQDGEAPKWSVPWTFEIFDAFIKKYGYDVQERLPELFMKCGDEKVSQVKWHYVDLLEDLFLHNFLQPIDNWCSRHNMILTGHVIQEETLGSQVNMMGSVMRCYEYMEIPGVDVLTEGDKRFWIVKQLASVARQVGKKFMLSELYACTGWQINFEGYKAQGDWQALYGINLRCPHLSWYTMEGEAKRDYPASILHQSGWYEDYNYLEAYYARLNLVLSQGKPFCHVLYITPVESLYGMIYPGCFGWQSSLDPEMLELEKAYADISTWLSQNKIDFDYGDEEMIARLASAEDGVFKLGEALYKVVIVGPMATIRSTTVGVLKRFAESGGTVIFTGGIPEYVDAVKSREAFCLSEQSRIISLEEQSLVNEVRKTIGRLFEIIDVSLDENIPDIHAQLRIEDDDMYLVAMNISTENSYKNTKIRIYRDAFVEELDCVSGERFRVPVRKQGGFVEWDTCFEPVKEHVYIITNREAAMLPEIKKYHTISLTPLSGNVKYTLSEPNVCVLDSAEYEYSYNGKIYRGKNDILKIDRAIRDISSLPYRNGDMLQPWFEKSLPHPVLGKLKLTFTFYVDKIPEGKPMLIVERPENFKIALNGQPISGYQKENWWIDEALKYVYLDTAILVKGPNSVIIETEFNKMINLEALYIAGHFGVVLDGTKKIITDIPETLAPGGITSQRLPFYSGSVSYEYQVSARVSAGERIFVCIPDYEAALMKISNQRGDYQIIAWQPYEADVTELLDGTGVLYITAVLTRRNTFGPLHELPVKVSRYGAWNFTTEGDQWSDGYVLYPAGLLSAPILEVRELISNDREERNR